MAPAGHERFQFGVIRSLAAIAGRSFDLLKCAVPVAIATTILAVVERSFRQGYTLDDDWLETPAWTLIVEFVTAYRTPLLLFVTLGASLKCLLLCWFTSTAFNTRNQLSLSLSEFARYVMRFSTIAVLLYLVFGGFGTFIIFVGSGLLYSPVYPVVEKAFIASIAIAALPLAVMLLSFSAYWSYLKATPTQIALAVAQSTRTYGIISYAFFCLRTFIDVGFGIAIPLLILSLPIAYVLRLVCVAALLSLLTLWLRGMGFEFNNSLFWTDDEGFQR